MRIHSRREFTWIAAAAAAVLCSAPVAVSAADVMAPEAKSEKRGSDQAPGAKPTDAASVDRIIAEWPERPRLGAVTMIAKYGPPQEASSEMLTWRDQGKFKRISVTKQEDHHDFPKPHMDFLQHTVSYRIPDEKLMELTKFDGSATYDRTQGELSARCDLEGHNILTLNLSNDVLTGKLSADEARKKFGELVMADSQGKKPPYVTTLQFEPMVGGAGFVDKPVMPGSPKRSDQAMDKAGAEGMGDADVLAYLIAINDNEIVAASEAQHKKVGSKVMEYATMLQREHGENLEQTMMLAKKTDITPIETKAVDQLRTKAAAGLAKLMPKDGEQFAAGYIDMMITGHQEVLDLIDSKLMPAAKKDEVKKHLAATRTHIANHLEAAKALKASTMH